MSIKDENDHHSTCGNNMLVQSLKHEKFSHLQYCLPPDQFTI